MQESNGPQEPSPARDFSQDLRQAQATGDYDFVLDTAKKSHHMMTEFRDAIKEAQFAGKSASAVAMGLNFLENMISNSAAQIAGLKQAEKQAREAIKSALKAKANPGVPMGVVEPSDERVNGTGPGPEAPSD